MNEEHYYPGSFLFDELEGRGWDVDKFSEISGISVATIKKLFDNQKRITKTLAKKLGRSLGTSAELWMNIQEQCDKWENEILKDEE